MALEQQLRSEPNFPQTLQDLKEPCGATVHMACVVQGFETPPHAVYASRRKPRTFVDTLQYFILHAPPLLQVILTRKWCGCLMTSHSRRPSEFRWSTKRTGFVRSPSPRCIPGILGYTRSKPLTTWARRCARRGSLWPTRGMACKGK